MSRGPTIAPRVTVGAKADVELEFCSSTRPMSKAKQDRNADDSRTEVFRSSDFMTFWRFELSGSGDDLYPSLWTSGMIGTTRLCIGIMIVLSRIHIAELTTSETSSRGFSAVGA
jgi:hypothetical protein